MGLTDAFTQALTDTTTTPPTTGAELVGYAGGPPALARLEVGLPATGRLPRQDTDPDRRRQYENAKRRFQRWAAPEGKQRTKNPPQAKVDDLRRRAVTAKKFPLIPQSRRRGARTRVVAWVTVNTPKPGGHPDRRLRNMRPARPLTAATMRQLTDEFLTNPDGAADHFKAAFLDTYAFPEADIEDGDIQEIKIWPDGTPEP